MSGRALRYRNAAHPARMRAPTSPSRGGKKSASLLSRGGGEGLLEKRAAELQAGRVDAMA